MTERQKILKLTEYFDKLKDVYYSALVSGEKSIGMSSTLNTIVDYIIVPMFPMYFELAVEMWLYMLRKYCNHCKSIDYSDIASEVIGKIDLEYSYWLLIGLKMKIQL